jgi:hypothetical protein
MGYRTGQFTGLTPQTALLPDKYLLQNNHPLFDLLFLNSRVTTDFQDVPYLQKIKGLRT